MSLLILSVLDRGTNYGTTCFRLQNTSNGFQPASDGLQPTSDGFNRLAMASNLLHPPSNGLQPTSDGLQLQDNRRRLCSPFRMYLCLASCRCAKKLYDMRD